MCVQESRWNRRKAGVIGCGIKLYHGVDRKGVGVILKCVHVSSVVEVERGSDRIMSLKVKLKGGMLSAF